MNIVILDNIKSLPPLPQSVAQIQKICNDPEASLNDLVKIIEHDPMMMANLLKEVNSPLYSLDKDVKMISQAVSLLGMNVTRSILLNNSIRKLLNVDMEPYGITAETFAKISAAQAMLAKIWYKHIDPDKVDDIFLAALLQETGKILIASYIINSNETTSFQSELKVSRNVADVERMYTEDSSGSIAAELFHHWKFDSMLVEMIRYSDEPYNAPEEIREYANVLHIIKTIIPVNDPFGQMPMQIGLEKAKNMEYDETVLQEAIEETFGQTILL